MSPLTQTTAVILFDFQASADGYEPAQVPFTVAGEEATELNVTLYRRGVSRPTTARPWLVEVVREESNEQTSPDTVPPVLAPANPDDGFKTTTALTPSSGDNSNVSLSAARWLTVGSGNDLKAGNETAFDDDYYYDDDSTPKVKAVVSSSASKATSPGKRAASHFSIAFCMCLLSWWF